MTAVTQIAVPDFARALSGLSRIDYEDAFRVVVDDAGGRTAESWMREVLEGSPQPVRKSLRSGWLFLGLKLGSAGASERVLGWEVRQSEPGLVRLGLDSRVGMPAELLLALREDSLLFCTFIRHGNPILRAAWAAGIARPHQEIVARLLRQAAQRGSGAPLRSAAGRVAA